MIILHRKVLFIIERRITKDEVLDAPISAYTEGNTRVIPIVEAPSFGRRSLEPHSVRLRHEEVVADRENQNPDERKSK